MFIGIFLLSTVYLDFAGLQEDLNALEVLFGAAWGFLDGYSVVAWLATCKTVRYCSSGWLEKSREAKRKFQEVRDYVCSGRVLLPGFDDEANMHISLLPLNPAKSFKSHNWGIYERFCRDNPFLNEWCFAKLTSSYEPWVAPNQNQGPHRWCKVAAFSRRVAALGPPQPQCICP